MPALDGFSLLELLLVLTLIAMLTCMTFPSYQSSSANLQGQIASAELLRAMHLARAEALLRGETVTVCASQDKKNCNGRWSDGLIVFSDPTQSGTIKDPAQLIRIFQRQPLQANLFWQAFPQSRFLQMLPSGLTRSENGTFWYCAVRAAKPGWAMAISKTARARMMYPDAAGDIHDSTGRLLRCDAW